MLDDPAASAVGALIAEPLVRRSATEDLEPRLVESVPTFANGGAMIDPNDGERIVATFRIRDGATWHDGAPVRAEDVLSAFELDRRAPEGDLRRLVADRIERIELVDRRTFRVAYRAGERWDLFALAPRALPSHLLGDENARVSWERSPVHAGPYMVEHRSEAVMALVPFGAHPIDDPRIERIVVRAFADRTALLAALGRGVVDLAPYPALDADLVRTLDRAADGSRSQVVYTPAQSVAVLRLGPPLDEPGIRDAVDLAIDRGRISRSVFAGRVRPAASYLVPPLWAAADLEVDAGPDRAAARAALARAGYRAGAFGLVSRDGTPLSGTLLVPRGASALLDTALGIVADLSAVGLAVGVVELRAAEIEERLRTGGFDLALVVEAADDPLIATERYRGLGPDWADVLADAARAARGRSDQRAIYGELQRLWSTSAPAVALYQVLKVDVVPARLEGVRPAAHGAPITWNAGAWRLAVP